MNKTPDMKVGSHADLLEATAESICQEAERGYTKV